MNKVILLGHMVADPEIRYTQSNVPICRFRLAVNKAGKPKEGQANAEFLKIVAWRGTAEFVGKYFKKGMQVLIEGHLKTSSWDDNGTKRYEEYTQADHVYFAGSKKNDQPQNAAAAPDNVIHENIASTGNDGVYYFNEDDEDIPF